MPFSSFNGLLGDGAADAFAESAARAGEWLSAIRLMNASGAAILRARLHEMEIDHVVLWVDDPKRALEFYVDVIGLEPVRAHDFEDGKAPFPSVRVNDTTIIDLMGRGLLPFVRKSTAGGESGGGPLNHVCLSMGTSAYDSLVTRLVEHGIGLTPGPRSSFGAQGVTPHSAYFRDLDGNVLEIRHYGREA